MLKAIAVGVRLKDYPKDKFDSEMIELNNLAKACDINVIDTITQELDEMNSLSYVGGGKVSEIKSLAETLNVDVIIFNDELSSTQISFLDDNLEVLIYDRTYLILEIFKQRARTRESIIQVELASLSYMMPRLAGLRKGLSRQRGAGGGFAHGRGAGETKLELDRRINSDKIVALKRELKELVRIRRTHREKRNNNEIKNVCLVGYTNSGKSTLLNSFLKMSKNYKNEKEVFNKDMLFATLETSSRRIEFSNSSIVLTDTVGFIEKLPHQLVEAFKSTLEEITEADLLVHVVDGSNPRCLEQIEVTNSVLTELGVTDIPVIYAYNKIDNNNFNITLENEYSDSIRISALNNTNLDYLYQMIINKLYADYTDIDLLIPYDDVKEFYAVKDILVINSYAETEEGIKVNIKSNDYIFNKLKKFVK